MDRHPFVGRQTELGKVIDALHRDVAGEGIVVLIDGEPGVGKSEFIRELIRVTEQTPAFVGVKVALGLCFADTGAQNAYYPFAEMLSSLYGSPDPSKGRLSKVGAIIKETAPDWMRVLPIVGDLAGAGAKTFAVATDVWFQTDDAKGRADSLLRQYVDAILHLAKGEALLILVIEDAQWIDHASCVLLQMLSDRMPGSRLAIVITSRSHELGPDHPMVKVTSGLLDRGRLEIVHLDRLDEVKIGAYLSLRYGTQFSTDFPRWLIRVSEGNSLLLSQYLTWLEQERIINSSDDGYRLDGSTELLDGRWQVDGRLADVPVPASIGELLDRRIQHIPDAERDMLEIGSVQGTTFESTVLAQVVDKKELDVLTQLNHIIEREKLIRLFVGEEWMRDKSEAYEFEHLLMQQAFYRRLSPRSRAIYHGQVAEVLQGLLLKFDVPPRRLLIDIAHHLEKGGDHLHAASNFLQAARASYEDGATIEAMQLCSEGLHSLRALTSAPDRDLLVAETVRLDILCGLFARSNATANQELLAVSAEGEAAAERAASPSILAEILALKGHLLVRVGKVPEAIAVMRRAVTIAEETGDPVTEFMAVTQLGSQLAKESLAESMLVRREANRIFETRLANADLPPGIREMVRRQHGSLLVLIGLGEFDQGDFETAIDFLDRGIKDLQSLRVTDELMAAFNYLAQVLAALGLYDAAQARLDESLETYDLHQRDRTHPWVGYNLSLLAHVLFEMGRVASAQDVMKDAVRISEATEHLDLLTLVWNYEAELLLNADRSDPDRAAAVLEKNLKVSAESSLRPAETMANSLMGQVLLLRQDASNALEHSSRAVAAIDRMGDLPAVRTEEILFNHWRVLDWLGRRDEALKSLERAQREVQRKAGLMRDPEHRRSFLENVPLNGRIAVAYAVNTQRSGEDVDVRT